MIRKRVLRTGDGSHRYASSEAKAKTARELVDAYNNNTSAHQEEDEHVDTLWGWGELCFLIIIEHFDMKFKFSGDDDMDAEEKKDVKVLHPKFGL